MSHHRGNIVSFDKRLAKLESDRLSLLKARQSLLKREKDDAERADYSKIHTRGLVLDRMRLSKWKADPILAAAEMASLDKELRDPVERAAFGLASRADATPKE